jgi:hypothetical protein
MRNSIVRWNRCRPDGGSSTCSVEETLSEGYVTLCGEMGASQNTPQPLMWGTLLYSACYG